jgi:hypothetical protein
MVENRLAFVGATFFLLGILFLILIIVRILKYAQKLRGKIGKKPRPPKTFWQGTFFLLGIICFLLAGLFFWGGKSLRSFFVYSPNYLAGEIKFVPESSSGTAGAYKLVYTIFSEDKKSYQREFFLSGDEYQLEGEYLEWGKGVKFLGVVSGYKITKINIIAKLSKDQSPADSVQRMYEFIESPSDLWYWIEKFDKVIPLVKAKSLKSEYFTLTPQQNRKIYITEDKIEVE